VRTLSYLLSGRGILRLGEMERGETYPEAGHEDSDFPRLHALSTECGQWWASVAHRTLCEVSLMWKSVKSLLHGRATRWRWMRRTGGRLVGDMYGIWTLFLVALRTSHGGKPRLADSATSCSTRESKVSRGHSEISEIVIQGKSLVNWL
jgi:hypothetical protein